MGYENKYATQSCSNFELLSEKALSFSEWKELRILIIKNLFNNGFKLLFFSF